MTHATARNAAPLAASTAKNRRRSRGESTATGGAPSRFAQSLLATVPILLAGSLAMTVVGAPAPADAASRPAGTTAKHRTPHLPTAARLLAAARPSVPSTYRVVPGDTVSSIASAYGLSTASVLAVNGLGWKSTIYPGQTIKLSKAAASSARLDSPIRTTSRYTVAAGDTVTAIAKRFAVGISAILSSNGLSSSSIIYPGTTLTIPGDSVTGSTIDTVPALSTARSTETTYSVARGDTVGGIAARFGVPLDSVLAANELMPQSIIYPGMELTIPTAATYVPGRGVVTLLTDVMEANARVIIREGRDLGVSDYGLVVALATAMQESGLRNIDYGHLDSVGLFQQRPSQGWGSVSALTDASVAARLFFVGNGPSTPGLLDISGWEDLSVTEAAQAVQVSAHPDAYAQWEQSARFWLQQLG
jgi:LysM repeat protein